MMIRLSLFFGFMFVSCRIFLNRINIQYKQNLIIKPSFIEVWQLSINSINFINNIDYLY